MSATTLLITALMVQSSLCFPYISYSPRSVPGRLKASSLPESLRDYISKYNADYYRNQQSQYGIPEYGPSYSQVYGTRRSHISPEAVSALLNYFAQNDARDYAYDTNSNSGSPSSYTDDEGTWYDDAADSSFDSGFDTFDNYDRVNQDAAILQLYLDHLNNKYSLEDLETLEREAAIEDNTESQLQAYRTQKKANLAPIRYRKTSASKTPAILPNRGQKEEAYIVPATSIRKPVQQTLNQERKEKDRMTTEPVASELPKPKSKEAKTDKDTSKETSTMPSGSSESTTTMGPYVKTAYDALLKYLNKERRLRQSADEAEQQLHTQHKRFVAEEPSVSLTQQLASLKKTVT